MTNSTVDWKVELLGQMDAYLDLYLMPRLDGLTDEEYFWEPVANCWNVHQHPDGTFTFDIPSNPAPDPAPFTTLGWRLTHLIGVFGMRTSRQFGDASFTWQTLPTPGSADSAIEALRTHVGTWRDGLAALSTEELGRPSGPTERVHGKAPLATLVLHVNRELMHHGGEICLLRDLYRYREGFSR